MRSLIRDDPEGTDLQVFSVLKFQLAYPIWHHSCIHISLWNSSHFIHVHIFFKKKKSVCSRAKLLTQAENYASKCYLPQGKRLAFVRKEQSSWILLQDWVSSPIILSDIWKWDPATCFWNDKQPRHSPLLCAWLPSRPFVAFGAGSPVERLKVERVLLWWSLTH